MGSFTGFDFESAQRGSGNVSVAGERIVRAACTKGSPSAFLAESLPISGAARVLEVVEAGVIRMVGVRRAVGINRHARFVEKHGTPRQMPDRNFTLRLAIMIRIWKLEPESFGGAGILRARLNDHLTLIAGVRALRSKSNSFCSRFSHILLQICSR